MRCRTVLALALASLFTVPMLGATAQAQDSESRIGAAAAVRGSVQLAALGPARAGASRAIGVNITSGTDFYLRDRIESGPDSGMQILLADETVFTIGPNSSLTIDEFVYNPGGGQGRLTANIARGAFRFVSGKVAASGQDAMKITTPAATIGIRGTVGGGVVDSTGTGAALFGPGPLTNEGTRPGTIAVFSNGLPTLQPTEVKAPGFSTYVGMNLPPTPPVFNPGFLQQIGGALQTQPPQQQQAQGGGAGGGTGGTGSDAVTGPGVSTAQVLQIDAQTGGVINAVQNVANPVNIGSFGSSGLQDAAFSLPSILRDGGAIGSAVPQNVQIPLIFQLTWTNLGSISDLDLHLNGPNGSGGTAHAFFSNTQSYGTAPFFALANDNGANTGQTSSEVMAVNGLNTGANYKVSVFNFSDQSNAASTTLRTQTNAKVDVITNGTLNLSSSNPVVTGGTLNGTFNVSNTTGSGNTWNVLVLDPVTRQVAPCSTISHTSGGSSGNTSTAC